MNYSDYFILVMEILGTISFASSGAMLAIQRRMDVFGVTILGVTTAVGGGVIRDLVLGITPPSMFRDSKYALVAIVTSLIIFALMYVRRQLFSGSFMLWYDKIMNFFDTVGLGIFTVVGMSTAITVGYSNNYFLMCFVGVVTGVGGGVMRDIMTGTMPNIFVKHIYAVASLAGALVFVFSYPKVPEIAGMLMGAGTVIAIRLLAAHYRWNLPRVR
ncbi:trimeric intracellular cation channel family protein [Butyricicoccus sp.]|uniref:trimeric intracellular cation channel family protein n=1 Tax=Butyricicoccus sp. TaxID=2049021 RepID=UPI003F1652A2